MRVEFFYDVVSPYSFVASLFLERQGKAWGLDVQRRPMFLGGVMKLTGNRPPASLPARAPYLAKDLARVGAHFGLTLRVPDGFPHRTLLAMRCLEIARREGRDDVLLPVSHALWHDAFVDGVIAQGQERLASLLSEAGAGDRAESWIGQAGSDDGKAALAESTDEAVARGVFGAPTLFVPREGGEDMWFGSDRFEMFAATYGLAYPGWSGEAHA